MTGLNGETESQFDLYAVILWMAALLQSIKGTVLQITIGFEAKFVQMAIQHVYIIFNSGFSLL